MIKIINFIMLSQYAQRSYAFLLSGFVLSLSAILASWFTDSSLLLSLAWLASSVGYILFIIGCLFYAKAKGYHWLVGLLGLFSLIGFIILLILPDKETGVERIN